MADRPQDPTIRAELVSLEMDANGLAVAMKIGDSAMRLESPVTSHEAILIYRLVAEIVRDTLGALGKKIVVLAPIEPNDPDDEYREPTP